jgi:hypothetical protein
MDLLSFDGVGVRPMRWRKQRSRVYSPGKKEGSYISIPSAFVYVSLSCGGLRLCYYENIITFWSRMPEIQTPDRFKRSFLKYDIWLTVHHLYKQCRRPTRCNNNNLLMFKSVQHVSDNFLLILRRARLCFTACGIMHPSCCRPVAWNVESLTMF